MKRSNDHVVDGELDALVASAPPAPVREVSGEPHVLLGPEVEGWVPAKGPRGIRSDGDGDRGALTTGALDVASLTVVADGTELRRGTDYELDEFWGALTGLGEWVGREVELSYRYGLRVLHGIVRTPSGLRLVPGVPGLADLHPGSETGSELVGTVYVDQFSTVPILLTATDPFDTVSGDQRDRLPHLRRALAEPRPARVLCWGDSITDGWEASTEDLAFPGLLRSSLAADGVVVESAAVPSSTTSDWLEPGGRPGCDLERVRAADPDVIVLEFVNDTQLTADQLRANYRRIVGLAAELESDLVLTTPSYFVPGWMSAPELDAPDDRPLTRFIRDFAAEHDVALADISGRWGALYRAGIPYPTLLRNGVNHPDDRGHRFAADEIATTLGWPGRIDATDLS